MSILASLAGFLPGYPARKYRPAGPIKGMNDADWGQMLHSLPSSTVPQGRPAEPYSCCTAVFSILCLLPSVRRHTHGRVVAAELT